MGGRLWKGLLRGRCFDGIFLWRERFENLCIRVQSLSSKVIFDGACDRRLSRAFILLFALFLVPSRNNVDSSRLRRMG